MPCLHSEVLGPTLPDPLEGIFSLVVAFPIERILSKPFRLLSPTAIQYPQ